MKWDCGNKISKQEKRRQGGERRGGERRKGRGGVQRGTLKQEAVMEREGEECGEKRTREDEDQKDLDKSRVQACWDKRGRECRSSP